MTAGEVIPASRVFTDVDIARDLETGRRLLRRHKGSRCLPRDDEQVGELLSRYCPEDYSVLSPSRRPGDVLYRHLASLVQDMKDGEMHSIYRTAAPAWAKKSYWHEGWSFAEGDVEAYEHQSAWVNLEVGAEKQTVWAFRVDTIDANGIATEGKPMVYIGGWEAEVPLSDLARAMRSAVRDLGVANELMED